VRFFGEYRQYRPDSSAVKVRPSGADVLGDSPSSGKPDMPQQEIAVAIAAHAIRKVALVADARAGPSGERSF
jgi:hypothetical protein